MGKLAGLGRYFVAVSMAAFGVQQLIHGDFVTRIVPKLPAWIPWHAFWAYLTGAGLIVAAVAILAGKNPRFVAALLGVLILLSAVLLYPPLAAAGPLLGPQWTNAGKALALSGAALLVAGTLREEKGGHMEWLGRLIPFGRFFLAAFLILCGIQHFIYTQFVAGLVPAWIPGHIFWTYFAGVALIAGGIGMTIPLTERLAAALSGLMIFSWVVMLHIPRALADIHNSNETTAVFEALAVSGAAFLVASAGLKQ